MPEEIHLEHSVATQYSNNRFLRRARPENYVQRALCIPGNHALAFTDVNSTYAIDSIDQSFPEAKWDNDKRYFTLPKKNGTLTVIRGVHRYPDGISFRAVGISDKLETYRLNNGIEDAIGLVVEDGGIPVLSSPGSPAAKGVEIGRASCRERVFPVV